MLLANLLVLVSFVLRLPLQVYCLLRLTVAELVVVNGGHFVFCAVW